MYEGTCEIFKFYVIMKDRWKMAIKQDYDLIIIGGGINGVAIARDAALRGMEVLLLEQDDYGCGASSKSSKLAHGGLRYLEHFAFGLVRDSLYERNRLLEAAPHLVKKLPFLFPVYEESLHSLWKVNLGLWIYDLLDKGSSMPWHRRLSVEELIRDFPQLKDKGLTGAGLYYDAQMQDNRLVIETMLAAHDLGADLWNHTAVLGLLKLDGKVCGVRYKSALRGWEGEARAAVVLNATGAWANQTLAQDDPGLPPLVRPTKGVHLLLDFPPPAAAWILSAPQDGRIFFLMPWGKQSLLGTTDTDYLGDPSAVGVSLEDQDYLLQAINHYLKGAPLGRQHVTASFAGLRPLQYTAEGKTSAVTRDHSIITSPSGLISVVGGKYTTHRKVAQDVVDTLTQQLCSTHKATLPGGQSHPLSHLRDEEYSLVAKEHGIDEEQLRHLVATYGSSYVEVLEWMQETEGGTQRLCLHHPHSVGELRYAVAIEQVLTVDDWLFRRTQIGLSPCGGRDSVESVARYIAEELYRSSLKHRA